MRKDLGGVGSVVRKRFRGVFVRFGSKRGWQGDVEDTILLRDIVLLDSGKRVSDHLWFNFTQGFSDAICSFLGVDYDFRQDDVQRMLLEHHAVFEFDGRVAEYVKGWQGRRAEEEGEASRSVDWKISHPTKVRIVGG